MWRVPQPLCIHKQRRLLATSSATCTTQNIRATFGTPNNAVCCLQTQHLCLLAHTHPVLAHSLQQGAT